MIMALFSYPIQLLLHYGYSALFVWSILEGEIGLILSGWLAQEGKVFTIEGIIPVVIAGAFIGDLSLFMIGRIFTKKVDHWFEKYPKKKQRTDQWLGRWGRWLIVFERFIYGTHIPVLLSLGMTRYGFLKFIFYDIVGIVLWTVTFSLFGYYFGEHIINWVVLVQKNLLVLFLVFVTAFFIWSIWEEDDID